MPTIQWLDNKNGDPDLDIPTTRTAALKLLGEHLALGDQRQQVAAQDRRAPGGRG